MATNFVQTGMLVNVTAPAAVTSGDVIEVGRLIGVAQTTVASGATVALALSGVFDVPKQAALAINAGDAVYWDAGAGEADTTNTNSRLGVCTQNAAGGDATVRVLISPGLAVI